MNSILLILILFIPAFASGIAVFFVQKKGTNFLKLILSFSGAYLFSITVLHLIPHVYQSTNTSPEILGIYVLAGFLFQLFLEQFSQGIEHGHIHTENEHGHHSHSFPIGIMFSLCLHAFLEGMPLAATHQTELALGISIHHIPAAFALGSILISTHLKKNTIIITLALFAAMTPFGFLLSKAISAGEVGNIQQYFDKIMAVVIGIFLHISTTILFESGSIDHHKFNKKKMIAVITGVAIALASFAFAGEHDHAHGHGEGDHAHDHEHHDHAH
ncbi:MULTISPECIES: ZIP family metal transporter [unclassified Sphingobacterium]|uniref:ZIP family metal transporter n=1 Tax=unclassified Sphingobacterium TaxID=2609468 RepID=UPI0025D7A7D1|nr:MULTISPECIES: ZIP family metal transporter [unclassified Sphingobacterium]